MQRTQARRLARNTLIASVLGLTAVTGCDCGEDPGADENDSGGGGETADTGAGTGGGDDGGGGSVDLGFDDAGNPITPGNPDGSPLEQPLSNFCSGRGTVVEVGGGGLCAGDVAEQTFRFVLCACESLSVQSTLSIDAFDSRVGPYGGANILDDGHLGVNGALGLDRKLSVRGGAYIGGGGFSVGPESLVTQNVYAAGSATQATSQSSIGRNAYFDGDVSGRIMIAGDLTVPPGATVEFPNLVSGTIHRAAIPSRAPCACGANEILDIPAITEYGRMHNDNAVRQVVTATAWENGTGTSSITLPCGRYYITRINAGQLNINAEGRTVLFVDGDMNIGGSLAVNLASGAELDLFIKGSLTVGASARLGSQAQPSAVRTYVGGTSTITMSASSVFGGNVYAPRAHVVFVASANLYGSLFAKSVEFGGSADVHFDSAIRNAGRTCEMPATDGGLSDGAVTPDGGVVDSGGAPSADGGATPADADPTADAMSTPAPDASTGPTGCSGICSGECGALACVVPEGMSTGMCTMCMSDLDCCAPLSCIGGVCRIEP